MMLARLQGQARAAFSSSSVCPSWAGAGWSGRAGRAGRAGLDVEWMHSNLLRQHVGVGVGVGVLASPRRRRRARRVRRDEAR